MAIRAKSAKTSATDGPASAAGTLSMAIRAYSAKARGRASACSSSDRAMREDHLSSSSKSKEVRKICSSVFGEYGLDVVAKGESTLQYPFVLFQECDALPREQKQRAASASSSGLSVLTSARASSLPISRR